MTFTEYQNATKATAMYPIPNQFVPIYPALGLAGEVGEVSEHIKKALRDDGGYVTAERQDKLYKELGDVLWYVARLADDLDLNLDDIAQTNIRKLEDRKDRGVLGGAGDNR